MKRTMFKGTCDRSGLGWLVFQLLVLIFCAPPSCAPPAGTTDDVRTAMGELDAPSTVTEDPYQGILVSAAQVTPESLRTWQGRFKCIALWLATDEESLVRASAQAIQEAGFELDYFVEIGRCPELADLHPEWMASLQGHAEWRHLFPDYPQASNGQVVKNYPWVPVAYRESFVAHLHRVREALRELPAARRIWLNDLQGGPSACGCGHPLCRWTTDYGPIKTATPLSASAAADFVMAVQSLAPESQIVPILTTECEREDRETVCCGVACFNGKCWQAWTEQMNAVSARVPQIGVACFYKAYERNLPRYHSPAGWIQFAVESFRELPPRRKGVGVPAGRLICVLQGWDVTAEEWDAQIARARQAGAGGWLVAMTPVEQSWRPVMYDTRRRVTVE